MLNLTHKEYFHLHGALPDSRIEQLIDENLDLEGKNIGEWKSTLFEAKAQFMDEDFLSKEVSMLQALVKNLRGDNRATLSKIIEHIEESILSQSRSSEYGCEELNKILKACN